jgi:hypothetical protein
MRGGSIIGFLMPKAHFLTPQLLVIHLKAFWSK